MVFDFKKAKAAAGKPKLIKPMKAIVLGTSGAGKSSLIGTTGLNVVLFYGKTEEHGATAAQTLAHRQGGTITPVEYTVWETTKDGKRFLNPDASIKNLMDMLTDPAVGEEFDAIAIDSLTELQAIYMQCKEFFDGCKTDKGVHNKWAEGDVFIRFVEQVRDCLIHLQEKGLHSFVTCAAMKSPLQQDSTVTSYEPNLRGFKVAQDVIRMFDDVLLVDRFEDEETEEVSHRLIFKANLEKKSKDMRGIITKSLNFQPRVSGYLVQELPATADACLAKVIAGRAKKNQKATETPSSK
jgi:hypothetical protein